MHRESNTAPAELISSQTEVVGQDGISYAPIRSKEHMLAIREQIAGWNGNPTDEDCATTLKDIGLFEWSTIKGYLDCLERNRTATNVAMLVPQGNLRLLACGPCDTVASQEEIVDQISLLRQAMHDGAVGMSRSVEYVARVKLLALIAPHSGLTYTPGMYASNSELASLCQVLASDFPGAYYAPHHRSYGHKAIDAYGEMLELGSRTGCPVRESSCPRCHSNPLTARSHSCYSELRGEQRSCTGARPDDRSDPGRRRGYHARYVSLLARMHDPGVAHAELGFIWRPGRDVEAS